MITVGEVLKKQRESLGKSIKEISLETKIQQRFIEFLEDNKFDEFDSPIYAQGFIKVYSKAINLDEERILAIYRRSQPLPSKNPFVAQRETSTKVVHIGKITPQLIGISVSILFLFVILGYVGYQIYKFQSPSQISIDSPEHETTVTQEIITINGSTDLNSTLFVNDTLVELDTNGNFSHEITLNSGINVVTVTSKKNNNTLESIETLKITYTPEDTNKEVPNEIIQEDNKVKLTITNTSVWVQLNVDKINKLSQIVQVGDEYEYEVKDNFSLTTGKIGSTQIFFNNNEINIPTNSSNIGELSCEIDKDNEIDCK